MKRNDKPSNGIKMAVCMLILSGLAGWVGRDFWPGIQPAQAWAYSAALVLGGLLAVSLAALASLTLWQWVLRKGGTDTQWLWFARDPAGLQAQRKR
ncbi:hypothetical protein [Chitinimonas sp. BJYL2]|uniref:hypothetical protein n=1 Tax=Chitinimonas sp. BJYL2 TaxID=2976696 RepID=UPI0022B4F905|nr:hypothetical protein [Chitinimonas sp. BJYL2]